jgi:uncharacterized repeat protein (TIGR03806 family)
VYPAGAAGGDVLIVRRALFCLALLACGGTSQPASPGGDGTYVTTPYPALSAYGVVELKAGMAVPRAGVTPYDLNTPLFSDDALKARALFLPKGAVAQYDADNAFSFPDGTLLIKSFGFRDDLRKAQPAVTWVETRLLIKSAAGWRGVTYLWDAAQTEATLDEAGEVRDISFVDAAGATQIAHYLVPSAAQCTQCHSNSGVMAPIGTKARNLNRSFTYPDGTAQNQLTHWTSAGILAGAPADPAQVPALPVWNDAAHYSVDARARAYLEVNCAHCHSASGFARTTGLFLAASETSSTAIGICKPPVAAGPATGGNSFDVVPGDPDHSVLAYRLAAIAPSIAMPLIGRSLVDTDGLALVRQWITALPGTCQ